MKFLSTIYNKINIQLFIFLLAVLSYQTVFAQCPPNIGFEQGDFTSWSGTTGSSSAATGSNPTIYTPTSGILTQGGGLPVTSRLEVTSGAGVDANSGLPVVCPSIPGNLHSAVLGGPVANYQAQQLITQFTPSPGNDNLLLYYSAVMYTGGSGHNVTNQPFFRIEILDQNGNLITCASPSITCPISAPLPPGWHTSAVNASYFYSDWTTVSANLSNYQGQVITVIITSGGCGLGGHWGMAYFDMTCSAFTVLNGYCPGSTQATLYAPVGLNNYTVYWDTLNTPPPYLGVGDSIVILAPDTSVIYACIIVPLPGTTGCQDTLNDTLHILPRPTAHFGFQNNFCAGSAMQFTDSSYTGVIGSNIISWYWDFGDPASGASNFSTQQNPSHAFTTTGVFSVTLIVTSDLSCVSDTAIYQTAFITQGAVTINSGPDLNLCYGQTGSINPVINPAAGAYNYSWVPTAGVASPNSLNPGVVSPTTTTTYILDLLANGQCHFYDTVVVVVAPPAPTVDAGLDDSICWGQSTTLNGSVVSGVPPNVAFSNANVNAPITDFVTTTDTIWVSGMPNATITSCNDICGICLNLTHTWDADLTLTLIAPNGQSVILSANNGGSGDNYTNTCFTPTATVNIAGQAAPFTGTFLPQAGSFCGLIGAPVNGGWVLKIYDGAGGDTGTLIDWGLCLVQSPPPITYFWTPTTALSNSTILNPVANPTVTTMYYLHAYDNVFCQSLDSVLITVVQPFNLTTTALPSSICTSPQGTSQLNASPLPAIAGYTYSWTPAIGLSATNIANPTATVTSDAWYWVTVTEPTFGCPLTDSVHIHILPTPVSNFAVSPNILCTTPTVSTNLNALCTYTGAYTPGPNAIYNWSFDTGASPATATTVGPHTINWSTLGNKNITLTVTDSGCVSPQTIHTVTVLSTPTSAFLAAPANICTGAGSIVTINYTGTGNFAAGDQPNWNFAGGTVVSGTGFGPYQVYWTTSGVKSISLQVVGANGCTSPITTQNVTVNLTPTSVFNITPLPTVCTGDQVTVTYLGNMTATATYSWNVTGTYAPALSGQGNSISWSSAGNQSVSLTVSENGCSSPLSAQFIQVNQTPTSNFTMPSQVCDGSPVNITYTGNAASSAVYNWSLTGTHNPVVIAGQNNTVIWSGVPGVQTVTLSVTENGCTSATTNSQSVTIIPIPVAAFSASSPVCAGSPVTFTFTGNNAPNPPTVFNWSWNGGTLISQTSTAGPWLVSFATAGTYNPTLTLNNSGCISNAYTQPVLVYPSPTITAFYSDTICTGERLVLSANGGASYNWTPGNIGTPTINVSPPVTTTYTVTGTDVNGCIGNASVIITVRPGPAIDAGRDTSIIVGHSVLLGDATSLSSNTYSWTPTSGLNNATSITPLATPNITTTYTLLATSVFGCTSTDQVIVVVEPCTQLIVPGAFTPNGDGMNDYFNIINRFGVESITRFEVFNRWGQRVFSTFDPASSGWDGKFNGVDQEAGAYSYFIIAKCLGGNEVTKDGNVTLIR